MMISSKTWITVELIFFVFPDQLFHIGRARPLYITPTIAPIRAEVWMKETLARARVIGKEKNRSISEVP